MPNESSSCPGVPDLCEHSQAVMSRLLEGPSDSRALTSAESMFGGCAPCGSQITMQLRFKAMIAQALVAPAPISLHDRITETLQGVDLGDIDVSDL